MKRILSLLLVFTFVGSLAFAEQPYGNRNAKSVASLEGGDADAVAVSGGDVLYSVAVTGVGAGDWAVLYFGSTTSGTFIIDVKVGAANDTTFIPFGDSGIALDSTNDIYVERVDTDVSVTLVYD